MAHRKFYLAVGELFHFYLKLKRRFRNFWKEADITRDICDLVHSGFAH